jgi:hypothetical protein
VASLMALTALGAREPAVIQVGPLTHHRTDDVALASVAARRGRMAILPRPPRRRACRCPIRPAIRRARPMPPSGPRPRCGFVEAPFASHELIADLLKAALWRCRQRHRTDRRLGRGSTWRPRSGTAAGAAVQRRFPLQVAERICHPDGDRASGRLPDQARTRARCGFTGRAPAKACCMRWKRRRFGPGKALLDEACFPIVKSSTY